jgi:hypothetical protein
MLESKIEQKFTLMVKQRGGMAPKWVSPGMAGVPDRIALLPDGHIGFVELKAPQQKPRAAQLARHRQLEALGFKVYVVDNPDKIEEVLDAIQTA